MRIKRPTSTIQQLVLRLVLRSSTSCEVGSYLSVEGSNVEVLAKAFGESTKLPTRFDLWPEADPKAKPH